MASRVLIVDSNLASNVLISKTLSKAGFETRTAFTAEEAMTRVSQDKFAIIVADLGMPNGESRTLLMRLSQNGTSDTVPVLALADGIEDQLAKSALQLGVTEIMPKPVAADALVLRVKRAIDRGPRGQVSQRLKKNERRGPTDSGGVPDSSPDLLEIGLTSGPIDRVNFAAVEDHDQTADIPGMAVGSSEAERPAAAASSTPAPARPEPPASAAKAPSASPALARTGATPTIAGSEKGKSGVSTIQLDARNFVDKNADRGPAPSTAALSEGDELGLERRTYTVVRELAAGAMGGTYLVRRTGEPGSAFAEDLECVLKLSFGDPVADESLRVEQLVLGSIDHANVVKLLDMGFLPGQDGARFVVLERLYPLPSSFFGRSRGSEQERAVDPVTVMRVYLNLVGGLHAIHAKHRLILGDIKPDNIMLRMAPLDAADPRASYSQRLARGEFEPVFIDFGSALSQEVLHTRKVETFTGSPAYMAPEVLTQGRHSARRDVFALSVTLYELITGEKPYGDAGERPIMELVDAIKRGVPAVDLEKVKALRFDESFAEAAGPDAAAARTQFLRNVADMIARGSDRDPSQRYSTYQLADECRIRFQVRPRPNAQAGARYETQLFQPLETTRLRYAPPRAPEPVPEIPIEPGTSRYQKSGRGPAPARGRGPAASGAPTDPLPLPLPGAPGGSAGITSGAYSAAGLTSGAYTAAGLFGPSPVPAAASGPGGAQAAAQKRLEAENAELRASYLRGEERARVAEASLAERDGSIKRLEERARQLDELARDRDQKRVELAEKLKRANERAAKAEEALAALEKSRGELEARAAKSDEELRALEKERKKSDTRAERAEEALSVLEASVRETEARARRAEEATMGAAAVAERWKEAAALLEKGAATAREAAQGAFGIAEASRRRTLTEVAGELGPLADAVDEARKARAADAPMKVEDAEPAKLFDALRALRQRAAPPGG